MQIAPTDRVSAAVSASGYVNRTAPLSQVNLGLGRRIDQNQTSLRSGLPSDPCPVYVRPRPPSPAVAIVSSHADSSIQITKPHRVTNQNSESQMNTSSRFTVGARFGKSQLWFELNAANWDDIHRLAPVPQHDHVGFVGGDALDHAAPSGPVKHAWALVVVEHGCGAGGELHPVQSLDHFQSPSGKHVHIVTQ